MELETMGSETRIDIPPQKNTCSICFDDDIQIFSIVLCGHWFCVECTKRHIETKLLEGRVPRCPHYGCKSDITLRSCAHLLTPKLSTIWLQKIKEESIPVIERVYCPNPSCSTLMSKTELYKFSFTKKARSMRCCFDCGEPFCMTCKVPWHSNLSCKDYKRLGPNPTKNDMMLKVLANKKMWRQCEKCSNVIELLEGCNHVTCRCGYEFCYICGAQWVQGRSCAHLRIYGARFFILCLPSLIFIVVSVLWAYGIINL